MNKWIRTWTVPLNLQSGPGEKFPGLSRKRGGATPWQILVLDSWTSLIRTCLSIGGHSILHCRSVFCVIKNEMAFSTPTAKKPVNLCTVHDGAVHTVQRSPFYKDIILTIGGWNMAIWKEGVMVSCLQNGGMGVWSFVIEKHNRNNCSYITVPVGNF